MLLALVVAASECWSEVALAGIRPLSGDFRVNEFTLGDQFGADVAVTDDGRFLLSWITGYFEGGPSRFTIIGRYVSDHGQLLGTDHRLTNLRTDLKDSEIQAGFAERLSLDNPLVLYWADGASEGDEEDVFAQRLSAAGGVKRYAQPVSGPAPFSQHGPDGGAWADGTVIVWQDYGDKEVGDQETVFGRRFDRVLRPLGDGFVVSSTNAGLPIEPSVGVAADGSFFISWSAVGRDGSGDGIFARCFDHDGNPTTDDFQVNTYSDGTQRHSTVVANGSAGFAVAWQTPTPTGRAAIAGRFFDAECQPIGSEFAISNDDSVSHVWPAGIWDGTDGYIFVWTADRGTRDFFAVYGRHVSASEHRPVFRINRDVGGFHALGAAHPLARMENGRMLVQWTKGPSADGFGTAVFARLFDLDPGFRSLCGDAHLNDLAIDVPDSLAILRAALGLVECDDCVCDTDSSGSVTANDALRALQHAVHDSPALVCPLCSDRRTPGRATPPPPFTSQRLERF